MFNLAPSGVYRAAKVTLRAGALLPHRFTLTGTSLPKPLAVSSLWHFPARHRDSRFASTLLYGAPTFLTAVSDDATTRPTHYPTSILPRFPPFAPGGGTVTVTGAGTLEEWMNRPRPPSTRVNVPSK